MLITMVTIAYSHAHIRINRKIPISQSSLLTKGSIAYKDIIRRLFLVGEGPVMAEADDGQPKRCTCGFWG